MGNYLPDAITLTCPHGGAFIYSEYIANYGPSVAEQAYNLCQNNPCPKDKWISDAVVNHCSVPSLIDFIVPEYFEPACDIHDMCYCVPGITQAACDGMFFGNLNRICLAQTFCNQTHPDYDNDDCENCGIWHQGCMLL